MWTPELNLKLLEILHDALKILGGGLVAGFFARLVAKHQTESALQKLKFERRTRVLDEVLAKAVALNGAFVAFYGNVTGLVSGGRVAESIEIEPASGELPAKTLRDKVKESHLAYAQMSVSWVEISTKLAILGEPQADKALQEFQSAVNRAVELWNGRKWKDDPDQAVLRIRSAYTAFCGEMRTAFDRR